ncbi:hypothetical protein MtrunA17_Chr5g0413281 [Medicago truncatula]|uniref:Uncharacterized protein n=1 Tax=Medicago truncatula TaxID=3880 RepID=A0A396HWG1_MEDTR|nr:hypothetical protein MtrunA17_Chr5g0413281 [Medicago truncatula]
MSDSVRIQHGIPDKYGAEKLLLLMYNLYFCIGEFNNQCENLN